LSPGSRLRRLVRASASCSPGRKPLPSWFTGSASWLRTRGLHLFPFRMFSWLFLPSLVATLPRMAMVDPCCGADYQGQNHRQPDAKNSATASEDPSIAPKIARAIGATRISASPCCSQGCRSLIADLGSCGCSVTTPAMCRIQFPRQVRASRDNQPMVPTGCQVTSKDSLTSTLCRFIGAGRGRRPLPISAAAAVFGLRLMCAAVIRG
jgi:hypothetical protein